MQHRVLAAVLLLSLLLLTSARPHASRAVAHRVDLKEVQSHRWFNQMPSILYNLCALYYINPDCLDDLFGEDFDISSMVAEVCPS